MKSIRKKTKEKSSKISVGNDEFCSRCMEWRKYDEEGRCKVCGKLIKTKTRRIQDVKPDQYGIDGELDESEIEFDGI